MPSVDDVMWERWEEVDRLLDEVLDQPIAQRTSFLAARTDADAPLRTLVQRLLDRLSDDHVRVSGPSDAIVRGAFSGDHDDSGSRDLEAGTPVGRYVIMARRGRGGMATVYEARRSDGSFEQRVAVKVLRRGLDTADLIRRFINERQILSSLSHPHIARLFDGGSLADGRPYLVMELVDGQPITAYANDAELDIPRRLQLLLEVCSAVHAAHRQLVVHRDIKPANIMVDTDGRVKLLDFGIAKLLEGDRSHTEPGIRLLTPEYASPEQKRGDAITTGTDIFQLGLLLRELIGGKDDAAMPGTEQIPNDLCIIVGKATREDPDERYLSVEDMASDVRRFLGGHPILAHPPSRRYRIRKFVARNPLVLPGTAAATIAILGFIAVLTVQNQRIGRERDAAELASRRALATESFLVDVLRSPDPRLATDDATPQEFTVVAAMQQGRTRVDSELRDQPEVRAALLEAMGRTFAGLGRYETADTLLQHSMMIYAELYGDWHPSTLRVLETIGRTYEDGRDYYRADTVLHEALRRRTATGVRDDSAVVHLLVDLSSARLDMNEIDSSRALLRRSMDILRVNGDTVGSNFALALTSLARTYRGLNHLDSAEVLYRRLLRIHQEREVKDLQTIAVTQNNLGYLLRVRGDLVGAEVAYREAVALAAEMFGDGHPRTLLYGSNLAAVLENQEKVGEVIALATKQVAAARAQWPQGHWRVGAQHVALGLFFMRVKRTHDALAPMQAGVDSYSATLGSEHPWTALARARLGLALWQSGRAGAANGQLTHAYRSFKAMTNRPNASLSNSIAEIITVLRADGNARQADQFASLVANR